MTHSYSKNLLSFQTYAKNNQLDKGHAKQDNFCKHIDKVDTCTVQFRE